MKLIRPLLTAAVLVAVASCASTPVEIPDGLQLEEATPATVDSSNRGSVMWGGVIVNNAVLESGTRLDVLAYPLDRIGRPLRGRESIGRFVAITSDLLEPLDFAPGREITLLGSLIETTQTSIGESRQELATVRITDQKLWRPGAPDQPRVTFGFGISIRN